MVIATQSRVKDRWSPTGRTENKQDYYVVREAVADYSDYWSPKADPDGVVRDRNTEAERQQYLADVADEIKYVNDHLTSEWDGVLDFGAGLGWFLSALKTKSRDAVEACRDTWAILQAQGYAVYADICEPHQGYHVVVAHHVFEHLQDPIAAIVQVRRVLRPGGYLVLGTPDFGSPCAKRFGESYRMLHDKTHCSLFTLESMTRFLRDYGFTILDVRFPFPDRYATAENFLRWNDTSKVSPPWPGNWMTFYARRA